MPETFASWCAERAALVAHSHKTHNERPDLSAFGTDGPPNLDACHIDWYDMLALSDVFGQLAAYAEHKGMAMMHRTRTQDIEAALSHEKAADSVYARLPKWARW